MLLFRLDLFGRFVFVGSIVICFVLLGVVRQDVCNTVTTY